MDFISKILKIYQECKDSIIKLFQIKSTSICLFLCLLIWVGCLLIQMYPQGIKINQDRVYAQTDEDEEETQLAFNPQIGVPVLCYHKIAPVDKIEGVPDGLVVTPQELEGQVEFFIKQGYSVITYQDLYNYMVKKKGIPEKSILITFDDGFQSNYTQLPILLKKYNIKAEIAVVAGGTRKVKGPVTNGASYFTWEHAKELQETGLINIVSHTLNHCNLTKAENLEYELKGSYDQILKYVGVKSNVIVYPYGFYSDLVIQKAKSCGYVLGVTIDRGLNYSGDDPMAVKRIIVSHGDTGQMILEKINSLKRK